MATASRPGYVVRQTAEADIPGIIALQKRTFPSMAIWKPDDLRRHLKAFPEGQLVAVDVEGRLLGSASSLVIDWDDYSDRAAWSDVTGRGSFDTHNPLGKTLYCADISVLPEARGRGVGTALYEARKKIVHERGLKRMLAGGRIPGYGAVADEMSPERYVSEVVAGKRRDATLSFQLANGFVVLDIIPAYLEDPASRGNATLLEWLNPEYTASLGLEPGLSEVGPAEAEKRPRSQGRVRIAAVQYSVSPIHSFDEFVARVTFFVESAREYECHFLVFPEYFSMQLLSLWREPAAGRAVRVLADSASRFQELFRNLAMSSGLYVIAGTFPLVERGQLFNAAHFFTPAGRVFRQKKVHLTPTEKGPYQMSRGHGFYVFHTKYCRVAILVCYDVEFPEAARVLAEGGAEILFVPSCTDDRQGYCRVRYCAQARAIENQMYVALTSTVGNLPQVPKMSINYGQAAILSPSDYNFPRDGIAAEGTLNQEQMIVADVDLGQLAEQRVKGTVIPLEDVIKDAYDRVLHYADR